MMSLIIYCLFSYIAFGIVVFTSKTCPFENISKIFLFIISPIMIPIMVGLKFREDIDKSYEPD